MLSLVLNPNLDIISISNEQGIIVDFCTKKKVPYGNRLIYIGETYVVKIDNNENDSICGKQCYLEYLNWANKISLSQLSYHFAEIYAYGKCYWKSKNRDYVIQRKVKISKGRRKEKHFYMINKLARMFNLSDVDTGTTNNWTVENGIPVIYDYGFNYNKEKCYER